MQANKTKAERSREANARYYRHHPKRELLHSAKRRAKEKDCQFDLRETDFEIPTVCPILGIPLVCGKGSITPNSPTLDRIVPLLGYIKGNVWVISARANLMKNDASIHELIDFAEWVARTYGI
jgi:hypothetical protein